MADLLSYQSTTKVVFIGTSESAKDENNLPPLPHVKNNIEDLIRLFKDPEVIGIDESQSIVKILDENEAVDILRKVTTAAREATDTLLVYYAGHGLYGDANEPLYLVAKNSTSKDKNIDAIGINKLKQVIAESRAPKRILILDCCYSGAAFEGGMGAKATAQQTIDVEGTYGVAAVPADHKALAPPGQRLTTFTKELVYVLGNGIPNNKSTLTLDDVFKEVVTRLKRKSSSLVPQVNNWREVAEFRFARNRYGKQNTSNELVRKVEELKEFVEKKFTRFDELIRELRHGPADEQDILLPPGVREIASQTQFEGYLTFISIVFVVFISIWVQPIISLYGETLTGQQLTGAQMLDAFLSWKTVRGALIFHILVCLWWWYGMFLGRIDPARSFFKYGFDFLTFCSFAITFRTWANPGVFPIMVLFSAGLMTVRFGITWKNWKQASNAHELGNALKALLYLLVTLSLFMIVAVVFVLSALVFKAKPEAMKPVIDWGVSGLLFIGVLATFGAVVATEGLTWSRPQRWFGYPRTQTMAGAERVADSDNANRRGNGGN